IKIKTTTGKVLSYQLPHLESNINENVLLFNPITGKGEQITKGQIIANGFSITDQELSLGNNLVIAYLSWEGFNFEDAIIINENILINDKLTSLHTKTVKLDFCSEELLDNFDLQVILPEG